MKERARGLGLTINSIGLQPVIETLGQELARGGFGHVYAIDEKKVAKEAIVNDITVTDLVFSRWIAENAQLKDRLVRMISWHLSDDGTRVTMILPRYKGDLLTEINDRPPEAYRLMPVRMAESKRWIKDVYSALCFLHKNSILHRDIKPDNILLEHNGGAVLADYGLSCRIDPPPPTHAGSPDFVHQKYLTDHQKQYRQSESSDLWSAVLCLYVTAMGACPNACERQRLVAYTKQYIRYDCGFHERSTYADFLTWIGAIEELLAWDPENTAPIEHTRVQRLLEEFHEDFTDVPGSFPRKVGNLTTTTEAGGNNVLVFF